MSTTDDDDDDGGGSTKSPASAFGHATMDLMGMETQIVDDGAFECDDDVTDRKDSTESATAVASKIDEPGSNSVKHQPAADGSEPPENDFDIRKNGATNLFEAETQVVDEPTLDGEAAAASFMEAETQVVTAASGEDKVAHDLMDAETQVVDGPVREHKSTVCLMEAETQVVTATSGEDNVAHNLMEAETQVVGEHRSTVGLMEAETQVVDDTPGKDKVEANFMEAETQVVDGPVREVKSTVVGHMEAETQVVGDTSGEGKVAANIMEAETQVVNTAISDVKAAAYSLMEADTQVEGDHDKAMDDDRPADLMQAETQVAFSDDINRSPGDEPQGVDEDVEMTEDAPEEVDEDEIVAVRAIVCGRNEDQADLGKTTDDPQTTGLPLTEAETQLVSEPESEPLFDSDDPEFEGPEPDDQGSVEVAKNQQQVSADDDDEDDDEEVRSNASEDLLADTSQQSLEATRTVEAELDEAEADGDDDVRRHSEDAEYEEHYTGATQLYHSQPDARDEQVNKLLRHYFS